jgi:sec-independent protein translocase protein TatA
MFGLSGEHLLILAGVLLIFGPRRLPELGSSIGKALRNFKEGLNHPPSSGQVGQGSLPTAEPQILPKPKTADIAASAGVNGDSSATAVAETLVSRDNQS